MLPPSVVQGLILVVVTVVDARTGCRVNRGAIAWSVGGLSRFSTTITEALYHCTLCYARLDRRGHAQIRPLLRHGRLAAQYRGHELLERLGRLRRERTTPRYALTVLVLSLLSITGLGCESPPTRGNAISMPVRHGIPLCAVPAGVALPEEPCPVCNFGDRVVTTLFGVFGGDRSWGGQGVSRVRASPSRPATPSFS